VAVDKKIPEELLTLHEELLKAQLQVIRRLREPKGTEGRTMEGRSNMSLVIDLLKKADHPLHISEIIRQAKERFDVALDRESLVSALVKKVRAGVVIRSAPNTFTVSR
jgi:hypothetical protein